MTCVCSRSARVLKSTPEFVVFHLNFSTFFFHLSSVFFFVSFGFLSLLLNVSIFRATESSFYFCALMLILYFMTMSYDFPLHAFTSMLLLLLLLLLLISKVVYLFFNLVCVFQCDHMCVRCDRVFPCDSFRMKQFYQNLSDTPWSDTHIPNAIACHMSYAHSSTLSRRR